MKVLMIGILSREYIRDNWLKPLEKICEVNYISVSVLTRVMSVERICGYMLEIFRSDHFDYVFYYPDGVHQIFKDEFFREVKRTTPVIVFYSDDEPVRWMNMNIPFDHRSNFIATHSKRAYEYRKNAGYSDELMYLQWGYNPKQFYPLSTEKNIDVAFMGSNFYGDGRYYHDGEFRQKFLCDIYEYCDENGYSFRVYGNHWDEHPVLKDVWGGFVPDSEINEILNNVKIIIGLGYTVDDNPTYQTKLKHFEIAGAGTFQLTNTNPDMVEIFGDSVPQAEGVSEFCEKIKYYLENEKEREKLAYEAHKICIEHCTTQERLLTMFKNADRIYYPDKERSFMSGFLGESDGGIKCSSLSVHKDKDEDKEKNEDLSEIIEELKTEGYTHVRFIENENESLDFNYRLLSSFLEKGKSIKTSVLYSTRNSIGNDNAERQRRTFDDNAVLIKDYIEKDNLWYKSIKETCIGFDSDEGFIPLSSFVIDIDSAMDIYEDCINNDIRYINSINNTKLIVSDIRIHPQGEYWKYRESKALRSFLERFGKDGTIVIWGVFSMLTPQIFEVLRKEKYNVIFADRNSGGGSINVGDEDKPVYYPLINSAELLEGTHIKPKAVVIGSINSGESMTSMLRDKNVQYDIMPLYDLNDNAWKKVGIV